jgi:hypothetical protein
MNGKFRNNSIAEITLRLLGFQDFKRFRGVMQDLIFGALDYKRYAYIERRIPL